MKTTIGITAILFAFLAPLSAHGQNVQKFETDSFLPLIVGLFIFIVIMIAFLFKAVSFYNFHFHRQNAQKMLPIDELDEASVDELIRLRRKVKSITQPVSKSVLILVFLLVQGTAFAEQNSSSGPSLMGQPGIIITVVLILLPILFGIIFLFTKLFALLRKISLRHSENAASAIADYLYFHEGEEIDNTLLRRKSVLSYKPESLIGAGVENGLDDKGLLNGIDEESAVTLVKAKKKQSVSNTAKVPNRDLILWFLGTSVFWLLFGTTVGEYVGIKFVSPEIDSVSWLSFGRLRPVHTNAVFWGWSSLAMLGLAHYVVPMVSNTRLASTKRGWYSLILINLSVLMGSICLMAGINNGGGEYREYVWPVMGLFGLGLIFSLINFITTIARRKSREIYISNWYIVSALIFTLTIAFIAYWPTWQNGLGETIIQGYYMHQGVGMWFMLFNLGLIYYFLPQQVNKPIYSYGLGILAFWSQIVFYTVIGTHHFVFSSIPWWLQTVAIVGSAGMVIPVLAGTTNFFMTFKGSWNKLSGSYTLPFFFVGILFYFTGSLQGTAEAFRYTNLLWHFTDFTVAHSHLTMYGIIAFLLWGGIYITVPRITGNEPSQLLTGIHFWMAFIGLLLYTIPLMIGGTLKGLQWMESKPFIESVTLMLPYWIWRAIGGSLMWLSHIVFAINFYRMISKARVPSIHKAAIHQLRYKIENSQPVSSSL